MLSKLRVKWAVQNILCYLGIHHWIGPVPQFQSIGGKEDSVIRVWVMVCIRCGKTRPASARELKIITEDIDV